MNVIETTAKLIAVLLTNFGLYVDVERTTVYMNLNEKAYLKIKVTLEETKHDCVCRSYHERTGKHISACPLFKE